jgi:hypothetical protein
VIEQHGISVERMQFPLHALLKNQVVELNRFVGLRRRFDITETLTARRDSGEESGEVVCLIGRKRFAVDGVDRNGVTHDLVNVALVTFVGFQLLHEFDGAVLAEAAGGFGDGVQRCVHVLGHAVRVTADIKVRAFLQPRPQLGGVFQYTILDVNFFPPDRARTRGRVG